MDLRKNINQETNYTIEGIKPLENQNTEPKKVYGVCIELSDVVILDLLKLGGSIVNTEYNFEERTIKLYIQGDKEHYPELQENCPYPHGLLLAHNNGECIDKMDLLLQDGTKRIFNEYVKKTELAKNKDGEFLVKIIDENQRRLRR
jgi:hypothetical protein